MLRADVSVIISKVPPSRAVVGWSIRWSGPTSMRPTCGMIRPTNPLTPLGDTTAPVINDPKMNSNSRYHRPTATPPESPKT
jgi:hypothetical protein